MNWIEKGLLPMWDGERINTKYSCKRQAVSCKQKPKGQYNKQNTATSCKRKAQRPIQKEEQLQAASEKPNVNYKASPIKITWFMDLIESKLYVDNGRKSISKNNGLEKLSSKNE
jgi:hypothetical protein